MKYLIFIVYSLIVVMGVPAYLILQGRCNLELSPPKSTDAQKSQLMYQKYFSSINSVQQLSIMITKDSSESDFPCRSLHNCSYLTKWEQNIIQYFSSDQNLKHFVKGFNSYSKLCPNTNNPLDINCLFAASLVLPKNCVHENNCDTYSMILEYDFSEQSKAKIDNFNKIAKFIANNQITGTSMDYMSMDTMMEDANSAVVGDTMTLNLISGLLAVVIVCLQLRSVLFLLIFVVTLVVSLSCTFNVLLLISYGMDQVPSWLNIIKFSFISLAPTMAVASAVAFSIDQNLFILTRQKEEIQIHSDKFIIAARVVKMSTHTVMISGLIITLCMFFNWIFQNDILTSMGVSAGVSIMFCVCTSVTLTPAILMSLHDMQSHCMKSDFQRIKEYFVNSNSNYNLDEGGEGNIAHNKSVNVEFIKDLDQNSKNDIEEDEIRFKLMYKNLQQKNLGFLFKFTSQFKNNYLSVVVLITTLCLFIYPASYSRHIKLSTANEAFIPYNSQSWYSQHNISNKFGTGTIFPLQVMVQTKGIKALSSDYFNHTNQIMKDIQNESLEDTGLKLLGMTALSLNDELITLNQNDFENCITFPYVSFICIFPSFQSMLKNNQASKSSEFISQQQIMTDIDLFTTKGTDQYNKLKDKFNQLSNNTDEDYEFFMTGIATGSLESLDLTIQQFPTVITVSILSALIIILISFQSQIIPFISIFFVMIMLSITQGVATQVYIYGGMEWTQIHNLAKFAQPKDESLGSLFFMGVAFDFPILVGLSIDQRVFLLNVVLELKEEGQDSKEAVSMAIHRTGGVIMTAGLIMVVAFGGLVFSQVAAMVQIGLILFVGISLDAFVNCIVLVPIVMQLMGDVAQYPRKFEKEITSKQVGQEKIKEIEDDQEIMGNSDIGFKKEIMM